RTWHQPEPVGTHRARGVRFGHLAEILHAHALLMQPPLGTAKDGEILNRVGVPVLEPAVGESPKVDVPAAPDDLQSVGSCPVALSEPVEGGRAVTAGGDVGQLLDLKILGLLLDLHTRTRCVFSAGWLFERGKEKKVEIKKEIEKPDLKLSPNQFQALCCFS